MTDTGNAAHASAPPASPCSMREACARAMLDRGGERCPACPLRELCRNEARWFVKAAPPH